MNKEQEEFFKNLKKEINMKYNEKYYYTSDEYIDDFEGNNK